MSHKQDQILLVEAYNSIVTQYYDEVLEETSFKNKLLAAGVGALGLASLGELGSRHIVNQDKAEKESIHSTGVGLQTNQDFKNTNELKNHIKNYFKLQGKNVNVEINGDNVQIGSKSISLKKLKMAVEEAKDQGYKSNLYGYLAQNL